MGEHFQVTLDLKFKQVLEISLSVSFSSAIYRKETLAEILDPGIHTISFYFDWLSCNKLFSHKQRDVEILIWNPVFLSDVEVDETECCS